LVLALAREIASGQLAPILVTFTYCSAPTKAREYPENANQTGMDSPRILLAGRNAATVFPERLARMGGPI
jgi:hypothetical protein